MNCVRVSCAARSNDDSISYLPFRGDVYDLNPGRRLCQAAAAAPTLRCQPWCAVLLASADVRRTARSRRGVEREGREPER